MNMVRSCFIMSVMNFARRKMRVTLMDNMPTVLRIFGLNGNGMNTAINNSKISRVDNIQFFSGKHWRPPKKNKNSD